MPDNKAMCIKLLILDVDGVMTDGTVTLDSSGEEIKSFNVKDGQGIKLLIKEGIDVAVISGRKSNAVKCRARNLGIADIYQGVNDKREVLFRLLEKKGLSKDQICFMGDDLPDIPLFKHSGLSIAVANAVREVQEEADFVTQKRGGKGAVREVCEIILKAQGKWAAIIENFRFSGK